VACMLTRTMDDFGVVVFRVVEGVPRRDSGMNQNQKSSVSVCLLVLPGVGVIWVFVPGIDQTETWIV
jgi:hypothetical protein